MPKEDKKITAFLNISLDCLMAQDKDLIEKLRKAARDDDMFKVHQLAYDVNRQIKTDDTNMGLMQKYELPEYDIRRFRQIETPPLNKLIKKKLDEDN